MQPGKGKENKKKKPRRTVVGAPGRYYLIGVIASYPGIRCMRIVVSKTGEGSNPLRFESGFSDPIDRISGSAIGTWGLRLKEVLDDIPGSA